MIKTIVKLVLAVAVLNGVYQSGTVAWNYYELKDEAQEVIRFGDGIPTSSLRDDIFDKATELGVPVDPEDIYVRQEGTRIIADVSYVQPVDLLPTFVYPVALSFSVEAFSIEIAR